MLLVVLLCILSPVTTFAQNGEKYIKNLRQITFGGDNAEAYWSFDNKKLCFQSNYTAWGLQCDQIFYLDTEKYNTEKREKPQLISTGMGRTTCAYFMPGDKTILYASTHLAGKNCPPPPAPRADKKYLWQIDPGYDIYLYP